MNTIYKLYDALLTIKEYCVSNNTCKDCPLIDSADFEFLQQIQHHVIGNWLSQQ